MTPVKIWLLELFGGHMATKMPQQSRTQNTAIDEAGIEKAFAAQNGGGLQEECGQRWNGKDGEVDRMAQFVRSRDGVALKA